MSSVLLSANVDDATSYFRAEPLKVFIHLKGVKAQDFRTIIRTYLPRSLHSFLCSFYFLGVPCFAVPMKVPLSLVHPGPMQLVAAFDPAPHSTTSPQAGIKQKRTHN